MFGFLFIDKYFLQIYNNRTLCQEKERKKQVILRKGQWIVLFIDYLRAKNIVKNKYDFEKRCSLAVGYVYHTSLNISGNLGSDTIARICREFPELNIRWLCTGIGSMVLLENEVEAHYKTAHEAACKEIEALRAIIEKLDSAREKEGE